MANHRRALTVIATAILLDIGLGLAYAAETPGLPWWHGLYTALANAVTVGGDVPPANTAGYVILTLECMLVVPLFGAAFSLFTSGLTAGHVRASEQRIKAHVEARLRVHTARLTGAASERLYRSDRDDPPHDRKKPPS